MKSAVIIGAGLTGCTIARALAENNIKCSVFEIGRIPGGLAADKVIDFPVSLYGPHIFHTNIMSICNFIFRFCELNCYEHRVVSSTEIGNLNWPINLNTICKIFRTNEVYKAEKLWNEDIVITRKKYFRRSTFEQKVKYDVGEKVYNIMIKNYSKCQWGKFYAKLPAELFKRIKIINSFDDKFFDDDIQGIPRNGYTALSFKMLNHPNISVSYHAKVKLSDLINFVKLRRIVISTAPLDEMANYKFGELDYQKIDFKEMSEIGRELFYDKECKDVGVINFAYPKSIYTRVTNYKRLACGKNGNDVITVEEPGSGVIAYPVRTRKNVELAKKYIQYMKKLGVIQAGRLGLFEYINMDEAIFKALNLVKLLLKKGI